MVWGKNGGPMRLGFYVHWSQIVQVLKVNLA
jgi:hypothetical protein